MNTRIEQLNNVLNKIGKLSNAMDTLITEITECVKEEENFKKKTQRNVRMKKEIIIMKEYLQLLKEHGELNPQIIECEIENKKKEDDLCNKYHIISKKEIDEAVELHPTELNKPSINNNIPEIVVKSRKMANCTPFSNRASSVDLTQLLNKLKERRSQIEPNP